MNKLKLMLGLICALVVLGATTATASASTICNGPAWVRTAPDPNSPVYGFLVNGQTFQVWGPAAGNFFHGYAFGGVNHEGYVNGNYLC